MQTTFPKIAAVILAVSAVAFMGFSVAVYFGRPNPIAEMGSAEIADYNFQVTAGETESWSVASSVGEDRSSKNFPNAYQAVMHAFTDKEKRLAADTADMKALTEKLREQIKAVKAGQDADKAALKTRIQQINQDVQDVDQKLSQRSEQLQQLSVNTAEVRRETAKRREDVKRLKSELEELRTDKYRLQEVLRVLTDRLVRLELEIQELELRGSGF